MARFNPKDFARPIPSRLVMGVMGPVNRWLISRGKGHALVHGAHAGAAR